MKKAVIFLLLLALVLSLAACAQKTDSEEILDRALKSMNIAPTAKEDIIWPSLVGEEYKDVHISFVSDNPGAISNDGQVSQALHEQTAVITVTVRLGDVSKEKKFTIKVPARALNAQERMEKALEELTIPTELTENLELPSTAGDGAVVITWASDNPEAVTAGGIITQNPYKGEDKTAKLTATLQCANSVGTKEFTVTVKPKGLESVTPSISIRFASLTDRDGKALLTLEGSAFLDPENTDRQLALAFDKDELLTLSENILTSEDSQAFKFQLEISSLEIEPGQWKDLHVVIRENGVEVKGDITVNESNKAEILSKNVTVADGKYEFKEWNGSLKVNREPVISVSKNSNETAFVEMINGKPTLVLLGTIGFTDDSSAARTITLELRENRLPGGKLVYKNLSQDADTRKYRFEADLSVLVENNLGNGDWVNLFLLLKEGERSYEGDVSRDAVVCDSNQPSLSIGYRRYYFEKWENYLKVVTSLDEGIKESNIFLSSTESVRLEQEGEDVYLILQGTAYISNSKLDVANRKIRLKLDGGIYVDNMYQGDGDNSHYYFKVKLNDYANFTVGMRIEVTEQLTEGGRSLTKDCEIKQAAWDDPAGAMIPKPGAGKLEELTGCGVYSAGGQTYSLWVDEWNNIKLRAVKEN